MCFQGQDGIAYELSRSVISDISSTFNPVDTDACLLEFIGRCQDVTGVASAAQSDHRLMLQQYQDVVKASLLPSLDQAMLQLLGTFIAFSTQVED